MLLVVLMMLVRVLLLVLVLLVFVLLLLLLLVIGGLFDIVGVLVGASSGCSCCSWPVVVGGGWRWLLWLSLLLSW